MFEKLKAKLKDSGAAKLAHKITDKVKGWVSPKGDNYEKIFAKFMAKGLGLSSKQKEQLITTGKLALTEKQKKIVESIKMFARGEIKFGPMEQEMKEVSKEDNDNEEMVEMT